MPDQQPSNSSPMPVGVPGDSIVRAANAALLDPAKRQLIRDMHDGGYPLIKMVQELQLDDELTDEVRTVIENLPTDVVEGIREATLTMLDSGTYAMPLDCNVQADDLPDGVAVEVGVIPENGAPTIQVRPSPNPAPST